MNIVFVCTGNTCRSPIAEGYAKSILKNHTISSKGLATDVNMPVSEKSVNALKRYNIDISNHISAQINISDIEKADFVFTMTGAHAEFLKSAFSVYSDKIFSLGEYTETDDIPDPYGQNQNAYDLCAESIIASINVLKEKLSYE